MDRTALRPIFDWGRCQMCMTVTEGWDSTSPAAGPCPSCGEQGCGAEWPPEPARMLLRQAFLREADDQDESAVKAFLVATALEVILGWVLRTAVDYLSTDDYEVAGLIERVREPQLTAEERLDLLEYVADVHLRPVSSLLEVPEFPGRWKDLRTRRDRFLHEQEASAFEGLSEAGLAETTRMAVRVLAHANNMI